MLLRIVIKCFNHEKRKIVNLVGGGRESLFDPLMQMHNNWNYL